MGAFDRAAGEPEDAGLSDLIRLSDLMMDDNGVDLAGAADMRLATPFDGVTRTLAGGDDDLANVNELTYRGADADDVDDRTGIHALTGVDDISIIAVPGQSGQIVQNAMITHCERMRYRIAVLDSAVNAKLVDIQAQRALYDSTRSALYYPLVENLESAWPTRGHTGYPAHQVMFAARLPVLILSAVCTKLQPI